MNPDFGFSSAGVVAGVLDGLVTVDVGFAGVKFKPGIGRAGGATEISK